MKKLVVEYIHPEKGATSDTFEGETVTFMTEPSGALLVFLSKGSASAAYGGGVWTQVYESA